VLSGGAIWVIAAIFSELSICELTKAKGQFTHDLFYKCITMKSYPKIQGNGPAISLREKFISFIHANDLGNKMHLFSYRLITFTLVSTG